MSINIALKIDIAKSEILSFVGGGGKTTAIFHLAKELKEKDKKVLITTTTKIGNPVGEEYDYFFQKNIPQLFKPKNKTITIFGQGIENEKLIGISLSMLNELVLEEKFDFILIEADGANKKPIKAPADHEPVVPDFTDKTIGIIGFDCLGKTIQEIAHRPEIFADIVNKSISDVIDVETISRLVNADNGLFKRAKGRKIFLLNKLNEVDRAVGQNIKRALQETGFDGDIVLGDIIKKKFY